MGFAANLFVSFFLQVAILLPGGDAWELQGAMESIYGSVPRIMFASFTAFLCGSFVNAYVMSKMKLSSGTKNFSLRAIVSTLWGEGVDSLLFFPIAFAGVFPWSVIFSLIISQALIKTAYEIIILPITIRVVKRLKRIEGGEEIIDKDISYKWWKINELD